MSEPEAGKAEGQNAAGGAGNAPAATEAGKAPGGANGSAPGRIPDEVMPLVEKLFDERLPKKLTEARTAWEQELADQKKRDSMSEADRLKADLASKDGRIQELERTATTNARVAELVAKSGGKVSPALAEKVVATHQGDWDVDAALAAGLEQARSLLQAWGFDPGAKGLPPNIPGSGGTPPSADESGLTDEAIDRAVREGRMKLEDANRIWDARRRAVRGR